MPAIPPLTAADSEARSVDPIAENLSALNALFPDAFSGGRVDFEVLKQLLGEIVDDGNEKYGLNWSGKRQARRLGLTPSAGTLLPTPNDSEGWDATRNLMIEGDNLEVLKLLQKSYSGKIKFIYIDPPYNTGNDFVYPDDYSDTLGNYLRRTGQVGEAGVRNSSNPESGGRYHTEWLNTMLPRLMQARGLLTDDGVIAVSINDKEFHNLRHLLDGIFGEENFISAIIWKSRQNKDNRSTNGVSIDHEYILSYGRRFRGDERKEGSYSNPDADPRGAWTSANMVGLATIDRRPNLHYDLINPATGVNYGCPPLGWRYEPNTMARLIQKGAILWPASVDGRPRRKAFLEDVTSEFTGFSSVIGRDLYTRDGTSDMSEVSGAVRAPTGPELNR